jgi:hypothetical protein
MDAEIDRLREDFKKVYHSKIQTTKDIEELAKKINIGNSTLRRFLGRMEAESKFSSATLNLICKHMGYSSFDDYCRPKNSSLLEQDFLKVFYDSVKGKDILTSERRYNDVNYQYAQKILETNENTKKNIEKFATNKVALEYTLAWHPHYGKITDPEYQEILINLGKVTDISHIKVFAPSFGLFGKFVSENFDDKKEIEKQLKLIDKQLVLMRKEYKWFFVFPEFRAAAARVLYYFHYNDHQNLEKEIQTQYSNLRKMTIKGYRVFFACYFADCLNLIGRYSEAKEFISEISKEDYEEFKKEYHYKRDKYLFCIVKGITLFHLGEKKESEKLFQEVSNVTFMEFPFDIRDYLALQYYLLGKLLYPKKTKFSDGFNSKIKEMKYTYFNRFN